MAAEQSAVCLQKPVSEGSVGAADWLQCAAWSPSGEDVVPVGRGRLQSARLEMDSTSVERFELKNLQFKSTSEESVDVNI